MSKTQDLDLLAISLNVDSVMSSKPSLARRSRTAEGNSGPLQNNQRHGNKRATLTSGKFGEGQTQNGESRQQAPARMGADAAELMTALDEALSEVAKFERAENIAAKKVFERTPQCPDVLYVRGPEHPFWLLNWTYCPATRRLNAGVLDRIIEKPPTKGHLAKGVLSRVPDLYILRAAEQLREIELAHEEACKRVKVETGYAEAVEAKEDAFEKLRRLSDRIHKSTPAAPSIEWLVLHAKLLKLWSAHEMWDYEESELIEPSSRHLRGFADLVLKARFPDPDNPQEKSGSIAVQPNID